MNGNLKNLNPEFSKFWKLWKLILKKIKSGILETLKIFGNWYLKKIKSGILETLENFGNENLKKWIRNFQNFGNLGNGHLKN